MATDTDFLSTQKNGVLAVNTLSQTNLFLAGNRTSPAYATSVILSTQAGWVSSVQVIQAGSAAGYIYNAQNFSGTIAANALMPITPSLGQQKAAVNFNNGLVLIPGPGQLVNVTYSLAQQPTAQ